MGIMADRLNSMVVNAASPDGMVGGAYRPTAGEVTVRFTGDGFRRYEERGLERQLAALAQRWWKGYERGYDLALAEATGRPVEHAEPWDARQRRFREEKSETASEGMSVNESVYFHSVGLRDFKVVIRDGALEQSDEETFAKEIATGYAAMMADYRSKFAQLREKHFNNR